MRVFRKEAVPFYSLLSEAENFEWSTECKNAVTDIQTIGIRIHSLRMLRLQELEQLVSKSKEPRVELLHMLAKLYVKISKNYSATKRELFAIVHFTQHFKKYLIGQHFLF